MFFNFPVIRLSTPITSFPSEINLSLRWEPKKPAAPVINTLFFDIYPNLLPFQKRNLISLLRIYIITLIMEFLYSLCLKFYSVLLGIVSVFHKKANLMINGRKN